MSDRRRNIFILLLVAGLLAASLAVIFSKPTRLGLDLQGGVQLIYQGKPTKEQPEVTPEALERALDVMRDRVDSLGVAEPELQRSGADQIDVSLPGVADVDRAVEIVGTTAQLYFYDWEPNILDEDCRTNPEQVNGGQQPVSGLFNAVKRASECPAETDNNNTHGGLFYAFDETSNEPLLDGVPSEDRAALEESLADQKPPLDDKAKILEIPEGVIVVRAVDDREPDQQQGDVDQWWVIKDNPVLGGTDIRNPEQNFEGGTGGPPIVTMEFSDRGRKSFADTTREIAQRGADNAGVTGLQDPIGASHHFAIRLDNELISTPYINFRENPDGIDGNQGAQISGGFTLQSAQDLARLLKIGALPLDLDLISRSQVSATLGQQALDQGLTAGLAGIVIVILFLVGYYRMLGLVASAALVIYAIYLLALIKLIPVTLTLPGIAGLVLTLGVAADANIVIFERVKEELRAGRGVAASLAAGYRKGLTAIVDANIVILMVAFILFMLATAGVRGFALTLALGVMVSLFTAVLATQAFLFTLRNSRVLKSKNAVHAEQRFKFRFDYMGASKWFFSMSGLILLIGGLAIATKGINFGIDFESGTRITAALERPASVAEVRDAVAPVGFDDAKIQTISNEELGDNVVQISAEESGRTNEVTNALDDAFGLTEDPEATEIGPTFGESVANAAIVAIIASLAVISVYITLRFEWKYSVPVLIALMHDILITAGVYALVGREVTTSTVAALLTILGYSLYDTIIVFDRVRENIPRMPSAAFSQILNRSLSEVLTRSLATSFSTLLPVLALFLFGGETLKDFAFALLVGVTSGAYSSIFIATPVLAHWKEREPTYRARARRILDSLGAIPAYAVATAGAPVDVEPTAKRRAAGALTGPQDPSQVSREEFDEMVRNLGIEEATARRAKPPAAAAAGRPAGGRRARARAQGGKPGPRQGGDGTAPPEGGAPGDQDKPKKPRNRRHGRPR